VELAREEARVMLWVLPARLGVLALAAACLRERELPAEDDEA
jgi:hypothetical protein